jgi:hypothetical protein
LLFHHAYVYWVSCLLLATVREAIFVDLMVCVLFFITVLLRSTSLRTIRYLDSFKSQTCTERKISSVILFQACHSYADHMGNVQSSRCLDLFLFCLLQETIKASAFQVTTSNFNKPKLLLTASKAENMNTDKWIVRSLDTTEQRNTSSDGNEKKKIPTRLVLHLDINETILLGDDAGGDSRHDSVQKMIAKSAFCQLPNTDTSTSWEDTQQAEPTRWWDGQVMGQETSIPPLYTGWTWPSGCCPYYRTGYKKISKQFVEQHHGKIYQPVLDECERQLAKSDGSSHLLPAFYQTLNYLIQLHEKERSEDNKIPITLVFRTFGSDIDEIASLLTKFAQESKCPWLELPPEKLYQGRWKELEDGSVTYQLWNPEETEIVASGDGEILQLLDKGSVFGIRDDYNYWKANEWYPTAGKPVWIPTYRKQSCFSHHLMFDDNIHNLANDGIACVRKQKDSDGSFVTVGSTIMHEESEGIHLVRVPTIEPVLNPNWFVEKIETATKLLQERITSI